ncbi:LysR family transcriptional regulator [Trinickia fusca]|uniref:LysR family transcriptional regulator n=1 Tax=Trinickia fusca TaxID=2419777 RepID=A0A494X049_9BURK|nr:LysR family transcriptional regulator [Trinickia fusca]RKP44135.1 LysR family transcriptional regulator [Trinickia fusca]
MDTLGGLVAFVRAAETRSFVAAARVLGISASAVGKSVARLEAQLGVRLFHRSTRSISLTEEGAAFFDRCRHALEELELAQSELSKATQTPRGRLRVSLPAVGYRLIMPVVPRFRQMYPDIELDLDFSDRLVDVIDEGFDAVIRGADLADSRLMSRGLGPYRLMLCASPEYLARYGVPREPADLATHQRLRFKVRSTGKLQEWLLDDVPAVQGMSSSQELVFNNLEALLMGALQGLGIAYLPDFAAREPLRDGGLQRVLEQCRTREGTFSILWPTSRHMVPRLRVFVDFLAEHLFDDERS